MKDQRTPGRIVTDLCEQACSYARQGNATAADIALAMAEDSAKHHHFPELAYHARSVVRFEKFKRGLV